MTAQPTEAEQNQGCSVCGVGSENEELLEQPDGSFKHPLCTEPEVQQPAEVEDEALEGKVIELRTERGALTLRPGQANLDSHQISALVAIGIDVKADPGVQAHIRPFMHMCQIRGLDPWAREAYLIGRGKDQYRKWTMQTSIDGYRKMAAATGRFIRVKKRLWTGRDDDDRSFVRVTDEDGDIVMQRVWYDQWPAERGEPGAAKVVIEHYDEYGNVTTTSTVADWGMFAPYNDKYEKVGGKSKRVYQDGKPVKVLTDMWVKGGPHMLAKCAEALCHRTAFPATMSGIYVHEEMHRADQIERDRQEAEMRAVRRASFEQAQAKRSAPQITAAPDQAQPAAPAESGDDTPSVPDLPGHEPVRAGEAAEEVVDALRQSAPSTAPSDTAAGAPTAPGRTPSERAALLMRELDWQAEVLGQKPSILARRRISALRKNLDAFTDTELLGVVGRLRELVASQLVEKGERDLAIRYGEAGQSGDVIDMDVVLDVVDAEVLPEDDARLDADPEQPHAYVNQGGVCAVCSRFEDEREIHPAD